MRYIPELGILLACLLLIAPLKTEDEFGMYHYSFDDDQLIKNCLKPKPLVFHLMYDFLTMVKGESNRPMQSCVLEGKGPGFTSPPAVARNIFAVTTMLYNTYARYHKRANPVTMYNEWTRVEQHEGKVPDCVYIYAFQQITNYLIPERLAHYKFREKYESLYYCNLTQVAASTNADLGLVQRDADHLISQLKVDGFNQEGCFADTTNFR